MPKGRRGRRSTSSKSRRRSSSKGRSRSNSNRAVIVAPEMMKGSCMYGGNYAPYSTNSSGDEAYARAIFGDRGEQVTDGMGGNHIKMNDPAVAWKGGARGGSMLGAAIVPVALLAANQMYKPSRGNKLRGSRKTMKKYGKRRR